MKLTKLSWCRRYSKDLLTLLIVVGVIVAAFHKTIFFGLPVSKVCMVAEWDSVFLAYAKGKLFPMDSTMVLMLIPAYLLKAELWRAGQLPLWNQLNGLGCPMLGDPQSLVLTPLHLLLIASPTMRAYNLTLVCEALVMGASAWALCRTLKLHPYSSLFGSLTLVFCPFLLCYLEILGNGYCLIPLLFTMFARAARIPTPLRCAWAGVACALLVLSSHPEISFFSITFASMFFCICRVTLCLDDRKGTESFLSISKQSIWRRAAVALMQLMIAAIVALCLAAPMLLPFAEFLANSESYKFDLRNPSRMPLETLGFNLLQPTFGGASPFLGVVALAVLPLCLLAKPKKAAMSLTLFGLAILAWCIGAKVWPLNILLEYKPFAYLITNYCFPVLLVLTSILAAIGFERLSILSKLGWFEPRRRLALACVIATCVLACVFLYIVKSLNIQLSNANFDMCLPSASLSRRDWLNDTILIAIFILTILLRPLWKNKFRTPTIFACIAIGFTSQALVAKASMPIQSRFDYPVTDVIQKLKQDSTHRYIATGNHLLRPNTGSVYGLSDLRQVNPIFPARYVKFMDAAGAKIDDFNQVFSNTLSPILNCAGVSSCLTQTPVIGETQWRESKNAAVHSQHLSAKDSKIPIPAALAQGLTISSLTHIDTADSGIFGEYTLTVTPDSINRYTIGFVLLGPNDETLWFGDQTMITSGGTFAYAVPAQGQSLPFKVGIHVFDLKSGAFVVPSGVTEKTGDVLTFAQINSASERRNEKLRASWVERTPIRFDGNIFLYSNKDALAESFIVHRAYHTNTGADSLERIKSPAFDPAKEVVLETTKAQAVLKPAEASNTNRDSTSLIRHSATRVIIETNSSSPGWLVLTDIFYPGWEARIDSKPVEILRANFAFRAIELPAGNHIVEFEYRPITVFIGFAIAFLCIAVLAAAHSIQFLLQRKRKT